MSKRLHIITSGTPVHLLNSSKEHYVIQPGYPLQGGATGDHYIIAFSELPSQNCSAVLLKIHRFLCPDLGLAPAFFSWFIREQPDDTRTWSLPRDGRCSLTRPTVWRVTEPQITEPTLRQGLENPQRERVGYIINSLSARSLIDWPWLVIYPDLEGHRRVIYERESIWG